MGKLKSGLSLPVPSCSCWTGNVTRGHPGWMLPRSLGQAENIILKCSNTNTIIHMHLHTVYYNYHQLSLTWMEHDVISCRFGMFWGVHGFDTGSLLRDRHQDSSEAVIHWHFSLEGAECIVAAMPNPMTFTRFTENFHWLAGCRCLHKHLCPVKIRWIFLYIA